MLEGFWYIVADSRRIRAGGPTQATLLNQPIALLRDRSHAVYALEDHCAHRGVPLSAGWQEGDSILEADTPAVWYRQLQRYRLDQLADTPCTHPVPEKTTLRMDHLKRKTIFR